MARKRSEESEAPELDASPPPDYGTRDWLWFPKENVLAGAPAKGYVVPPIRYCPSCGGIQEEPINVSYNQQGTMKWTTCTRPGCGALFATLGVEAP